MHDTIEIESRGIRGVFVATVEFTDGAEAQARALGADPFAVEAAGFACDVADYAQVEALAHFAEEKYGGADAIMNNAGGMIPPSTVIDANLAQIEFLMKVNYFGVWNGVSVFGKRFIERARTLP